MTFYITTLTWDETEWEKDNLMHCDKSPGLINVHATNKERKK